MNQRHPHGSLPSLEPLEKTAQNRDATGIIPGRNQVYNSSSGALAMRWILIANDDGIYSPGIAALAEVAAKFGDVRIVAPT